MLSIECQTLIVMRSHFTKSYKKRSNSEIIGINALVKTL